MPRLKLLLNLGKPDAARLGIDFAEAREGKVVTVDDEVGNELLTKGWAADPNDERFKAAAAAPAVAATPAAPQVAPPPPDFDAMTKEELKAFADDKKVEGINMAMHKDEMVRLLKRQVKT